MKSNLLITAITFTCLANAQGTWTQKANFSGTARNYAVGFSIGSNGYIGTGNDGGVTQDFWEWNQATNIWTQKANFGGSARDRAVGFSIGNKGYIGTGVYLSYYQDFWEWDQATNVWSQKTNFGGTGRYGAVGFSIGTKGYIGTGLDGLSNYNTDFWEWNQATDVWTQKANFGGVGRRHAVAFSIGTKGYIGTGQNISGILQDFWEWDQSANIWTQKANFGGTARASAVGFSIGTKGYIGTGTGPSGDTQDFWEWDQASNTWTQKINFGGTVRDASTGFSIGTKGYIGTGYSGFNKQDFWEWYSLTLSISKTNVSCYGGNNGSATAIVSGGAPSYTYSWSSGQTTTGITGLIPGNYTITVTDATGYSLTTTVTITQSPIINISITSPTTICFGDCATLTSNASGGNGGFTYSWQPVGSTANTIVVCPSITSNYTMIATDVLGCTDIDSTSVGISLLMVSLTLNPDTICVNAGGYPLTGGSPNGGTYSGIGIISGIFYPNLAGVGSHTISYSYTNIYGCSDTATSQIYVSSCTDVPFISNLQFINIFPNPSNGTFTIQTDNWQITAVVKIEITNMLGEKIYSGQINSDKTVIDLSKQQDGIYFVQLKTEQGIIARKIILNR